MNRHLILLTLLSALGYGNSLNAQFLNIKIAIPAGVNFTTNTATKVFSESAGTAYYGQAPTTWIAMETMENLSFLVSISNQDEEQDEVPKGHYISESNWNSAEAKEMTPGLNQLVVDKRNLLIKNIYPKTSFLQGWLGISSNKALHITIEYP
jgi:hypothetical protein